MKHQSANNQSQFLNKGVAFSIQHLRFGLQRSSDCLIITFWKFENPNRVPINQQSNLFNNTSIEIIFALQINTSLTIISFRLLVSIFPGLQGVHQAFKQEKVD